MRQKSPSLGTLKKLMEERLKELVFISLQSRSRQYRVRCWSL